MPVDRSLSDFEAVGPEPNAVENLLDRNARHILVAKDPKVWAEGFSETHAL